MAALTSEQPLTGDQLARVNTRIRLAPREQLAMHDVFGRLLPPGSAAYLFGSRTDLSAVGGDIDLLIHVPGIGFDTELSLGTQLRDALIAQLGERKIDLLFTPTLDESAKPFVRLALVDSVRLYP
jgi:hypothetical protein